MGILYSIGSSLVSPAELEEKAAIGILSRFSNGVKSGDFETIEFSSGSTTTNEVADLDRAIPFEPVGMNKPLTIEFLSAYTGDAPGRSWFDRVVGRSKPDLLIASGAKSVRVGGVAPRGINQIIADIDDEKYYQPGAHNEGSPIIYHSPAMVDTTTFVSVEMVVDSFTGDVFSQLGNLFTVAAGLPVFAPAAAFLVAGSVIVKMGKKLAEAFAETGPFLRVNEDIRLMSAGYPVELARFMLLAEDKDLEEFKAYTPLVVEEGGNAKVTLVKKQGGDRYQGKSPFILASLDGRERTDLKGFQARHASAALMDQFYAKGNTIAAVGNIMEEAMTLYNDFRFRKDAESSQKLLAALPEGSVEYMTTKARLDAQLKNIQTPELQID